MTTAYSLADSGYIEESFLSALNLFTIVMAIFGFAGVVRVRQVMTFRQRSDQSLRSGMRQAFLTGAPIGVIVGFAMEDFDVGMIFEPWYLENFLGDIVNFFILPALGVGILWMLLYIPWHLIRQVFKNPNP